jgi:hypothetical protein
MVSHEQDSSLNTLLTEAQVKHGDTIRTTIVVGAVQIDGSPETHLTLCPAVMGDFEILAHGTPEENATSISGPVVFENKDLIHRIVAGRNGWFRCTAEIHTNGTTTVKVLEEALPLFFLARPGESLATKRGKPRAGEILNAPVEMAC